MRHADILMDGYVPCSQVDRQIEQMVKFIRQEAEEKSNEIKVSAEEVGGIPSCTSLPCLLANMMNVLMLLV